MMVDLEKFLREKFHFPSFRQGQKEVISSILEGKDTIAVLPTGTGKSLCYQIPGYLLQGTVIIVSPLLSLMHDQVEQLQMKGEKRAAAVNSFLSFDEKREIIQSMNTYRFLFFSPEMLERKEIIQRLKEINISLFVVDEAHCIAQWGYDFRPDYLKLGKVRRQLGNPLTLALTATAGKDVVEEIASVLQLDHWAQFVYSVDRPNIAMAAIHCSSFNSKKEYIEKMAAQLAGPGIIYFSSRKMAEEMARELEKKGIGRTAAYHGEMDSENRILVQQQFLHGQLDLICATSAFGMGINKDNVRFVIHFHMPLAIESYVQEMGRAGRDGNKSIAILLYADGDDQLAYSIAENELPTEGQIERIGEWLSDTGGFSVLEQKKESLYAYAGLNEIQGRVSLHFLLNKWEEGICETEAVNHFRQFVAMRNEIKRKKINEMKRWILEKGCRREKILNYFNEQKKIKIENCCDCCGIDWKTFRRQNFSPEERQELYGWEKYLASILLK